MKPDIAISLIKSKFESVDTTAQIPLMYKNKFFTATLRNNGIEVNNLHNQELIEWKTFEIVVKLLNSKGVNVKVKKGNALSGKLGEEKLPIDSIEGYVAKKIYGKKEGDSVFRRISPIAGILAWASVCKNSRGYLSLNT